MPRAKHDETAIAKLAAAAEGMEARNPGSGWTAGRLLASLIRKHGQAEAARRCGVARGSLNHLMLKAGVRFEDVVLRPGETYVVVRDLG